MESKSYRVAEIRYNLIVDFELLSLPKQLKLERIQEYIKFYYNSYQSGPTLIIEDKLCRKKMNLYRSIAQRIKIRVYDGLHINKLLALEELTDVCEIIEREILSIWNITEFVDFFAQEVCAIVTKKQLLGLCEKTKKKSKQNKCPSFYNRDKVSYSVKQQFRMRQKDYFW